MTINLRDLKDLRKKYNLTQYDMAIYIGVSDVAYRTWESNVRRPKEKHINKLNEIFSILKDSDEAVGNREAAIELLNEVLFVE